MQSMIRFSLFGNYERFSTNNLDSYIRLIEFFGKRGYKPSTANELQLQPNGQARVLTMPNFLNETGATVEITSNRINFQKDINDVVEIGTLGEEFENEFLELLDALIADMSITSNRVALNCDILKTDTTLEIPIQSGYFDNVSEKCCPQGVGKRGEQYNF